MKLVMRRGLFTHKRFSMAKPRWSIIIASPLSPQLQTVSWTDPLPSGRPALLLRALRRDDFRALRSNFIVAFVIIEPGRPAAAKEGVASRC